MNRQTTDDVNLLDWFAVREMLTDFDDAQIIPNLKMCEALAGTQPDSTDPIESLKWEAKWRAAFKYIRAEAMLSESNKHAF